MGINPLRIAGTLHLMVVGAGFPPFIACEHNAGVCDFIDHYVWTLPAPITPFRYIMHDSCAIVFPAEAAP